MEGKKQWYIVDGYRPSPQPDPDAVYEGHESIMILNTNDQDTHVLISIYFEDREPVENIPYLVPAKRIRCFKRNDSQVLGGLEIGIGVQYSMALKDNLLLSYGNEAEPQYVRYFSNYWPSFETAGVLIPAEGEPLLLIGPESYTYAADRSKIEKIRLLKVFRESSEPEYPGKKLDTFQSVFAEALGDKQIRRFGVAGLPPMTIGVYEALTAALDGVKVEKRMRS